MNIDEYFIKGKIDDFYSNLNKLNYLKKCFFEFNKPFDKTNYIILTCSKNYTVSSLKKSNNFFKDSNLKSWLKTLLKNILKILFKLYQYTNNKYITSTLLYE